MDVKAAARAKHALSQRGRARHSSHKHAPKSVPASAPTPSSSSDDKQQSQQQSSRLPSNWDRYEEEEPLELDARLSAPAVKSKGANYRDLLAEKSMYQSPELADARKRLMQSRAHHIFDQRSNPDDIWSIHGILDGEDLFFSLDLKFLEQELAKVNISERLFIDPKFILTEEKDIEVSQDGSINKDEDWDNKVSDSRGDVNTDERLAEQLSSTSIISAAASSHPEDCIEHHTIDLRGTDESEILKRDESRVFGKPLTAYQVQNTNWDTRSDIVFKPETAEAELDALLNMLDGHSDKKHLESAPAILTGSNLNHQKRSPTIVSDDDQNTGDHAQLGNSFTIGVTDDIFSTANEPQKPSNVWNIQQHTRVETASLSISSEVPYECVSGIEKQGKDFGSVNQPVKLDDDFDSWLDSL